LTNLLDDYRRGRRVRLSATGAIPRLGLAIVEKAQPLDVELRNPVGGIARQGLLVCFESLGMATKLGQRLTEAVVCVGVGAELEKLAIGLDGRLPVAARGMADRHISELSP